MELFAPAYPSYANRVHMAICLRNSQLALCNQQQHQQLKKKSSQWWTMCLTRNWSCNNVDKLHGFVQCKNWFYRNAFPFHTYIRLRRNYCSHRSAARSQLHESKVHVAWVVSGEPFCQSDRGCPIGTNSNMEWTTLLGQLERYPRSACPISLGMYVHLVMVL